MKNGAKGVLGVNLVNSNKSKKRKSVKKHSQRFKSLIALLLIQMHCTSSIACSYGCQHYQRDA